MFESIHIPLGIEDNTPSIHFLKPAMRLEIAGKSLPVDTFAFYKPRFDWLDNNLPLIQEPFTVQLNFYYFNTSSSKAILIILEKIAEAIKEKHKSITVEWFYNSEETEMAGFDYQDITGLQFVFIPVKPK